MEASEINSVDFQDGKAVAVFAEKTNLENDLNNDFKHEKTSLVKGDQFSRR